MSAAHSTALYLLWGQTSSNLCLPRGGNWAVTVEYWQEVATVIAAKMLWAESWSIFPLFQISFSGDFLKLDSQIKSRLLFPVSQEARSECSIRIQKSASFYNGLFVHDYLKFPWESNVFSVNNFWQLYLSFPGIIMGQAASGEEYLLQ